MSRLFTTMSVLGRLTVLRFFCKSYSSDSFKCDSTLYLNCQLKIVQSISKNIMQNQFNHKNKMK